MSLNPFRMPSLRDKLAAQEEQRLQELAKIEEKAEKEDIKALKKVVIIKKKSRKK